MEVILSIKPRYGALIMAGTKKCELRRKIWQQSNVVERVYIYLSDPVRLVVGYFKPRVIAWNQCPNYDLWRIVENDCGITFPEYYAYILGSESKYAIYIDDLVLFDRPRGITEFGIKKPPQNFCYYKHL